MSPMTWVLGLFRESEQEETDFSIILAAGPISVFCTLLVGLQRNSNLDLIVLAILGTIFCMKGRMRGWVYSAILLAVSAVVKHAFFIETHHLWQMGIEGSMLAGFAMSAAALDLLHCKETNLFAQIDSKEKTIHHLEEELNKTRQEALDEQISSQNRLSALQKDFDENQSEISSLQILNEVLRKSAAQTNQEREEIAQKFVKNEQQSINLIREIEKLKSEASLSQKKIDEREFELNRLQEQTAERDQAIGLLQEQLQKLKSEAALLQEKIDERGLELDRLQSQSQSVAKQTADRDQAIGLLQEQLQKLKSEATLSQEKMAERELELNRLQSQMQGIAEQLAERDQAILLLQERLQAAAHKEGLYLELRKQFDEKNRVLHQTRAELFQTNTALEAVHLEQEQQKAGETPDIERVLSNELAALEQERHVLEQENEKLFDLVTLLSKESAVQIMERLKKHKQKLDPAERAAYMSSTPSGMDQAKLSDNAVSDLSCSASLISSDLSTAEEQTLKKRTRKKKEITLGDKTLL